MSEPRNQPADQDGRAQALVLDVAAHRVWLGEQELYLTPREFAVLVYLAHRMGYLVTDTELLDAVWGTAAVVGDEALRTVIKRLRRKMGEDPKRPRYITTVWGHGYRFERVGLALRIV